jgi:hypothetical protein
MALNNTSTRDRTWTEFYDQEGENINMLGITNRKELRHFECITLGLTNDPTALIRVTSTYPYNWMIVAGATAQGKVNIVHHAFSVAETTHKDPRIVGVTGNRKTLALKSFDPIIATKNLSPVSNKTRTGTEKKVPSIQQFLSATSAQRFQALNGGKNEEQVSTLSKYPNLFWIHSSVFEALEAKASLKAVDAAMQILTQLKNKTPSEDESEIEEEDPDDAPATALQKNCHSILTFSSLSKLQVNLYQSPVLFPVVLKPMRDNVAARRTPPRIHRQWRLLKNRKSWIFMTQWTISWM